MKTNQAASVQARLLARAKAQNEDFNLTLTRYALERMLYCLSISPAQDRFVLKGAMLFSLWFDVPHRPTRDADFLGFDAADSEALQVTFSEVCAIHSDDGMIFDPASVSAEEIREGNRYGGLRVKLTGTLGLARCPVQLDVGFGDAITPGPEEVIFPLLLEDMPAPKLRVYPRATVAAEKLEAIVDLGMTNSRMKDYFDLLALAREGALDKEILTRAISATFARRRTALPEETPISLSLEFATDPRKQTQWNSFLAKNKLEAPSLLDVVEEVRVFVGPSLRSARQTE